MYNEKLFTALHSIKKPFPNLDIDLIHNGFNYVILVYQNNINSFNETQRKIIMEYLLELRDTFPKFNERAIISPAKGDKPL